MVLIHERVQYPIGQGFFHAGSVKIGPAAFRYVCDCGSTALKPLDREIDRYINDSADTIDALFLSHIDNDHVSGLDRLLSRVSVDSVFLPLLTPISRLALVAHAIDQNTLNASNLGLLADPGVWLRERGAGRVFFISGDEGPETNGVSPFAPDREPPNHVTSIGFHVDKLTHISDEYEARHFNVPGLRSKATAAIRRGRSANPETYVLPHSVPLFIVVNGTAIVDWVFVAYVRSDHDMESRFQAIVKQVLAPIPTTAHKFRQWIFDLVRSRDNRRILRGCYHTARVDVNAMSMSLYSGPTGMVGGVRTTVRWSQDDDHWGWVTEPEAATCGWLGTGDSDLSSEALLAPFRSHYVQVLDQVSTMPLPHHGSLYNFSPALRDLGPSRFVVSSRTKNRHHPHPTVRRAIEPEDLIHVTEIEGTDFQEAVSRESDPAS